MKKLSGWYNARENRKDVPEYVTKNPSCTVPGQSMTIAEVEARYRRGQSLPSAPKEAIYTGDADFIDINKLDKVERAELSRRNRQRIGHVRNELTAREEKKKKQMEEAKIQAKVEEALKAKKKYDDAEYIVKE